jgi:hypothetical protein
MVRGSIQTQDRDFRLMGRHKLRGDSLERFEHSFIPPMPNARAAEANKCAQLLL